MKSVECAVILAAGMGSRLPQAYQNKPKGFLLLENEPIIERSIRLLKESGVKKIVIGTGFHSNFYDSLKEKYSNIVCLKNKDYKNSGSHETLLLLSRLLDEDFLLLESDILYEKVALNKVITSNHENVILASSFTDSGDEVYIETDDNFFLKKLSKDKNVLSKTYAELVGISKVSKNLYQKLIDHQGHIRPSSIHYEEAFVEVAKLCPIYIERVNDLLWAEIDTREHLIRAQNNIYPKIKEKEKCQSQLQEIYC